MTNLISLSRCATIAALVSFAALPALANSGADSFAPGGNGPDGPGPGNWGGPDGFAPNPGPGPGPGTPAGGGGDWSYRLRCLPTRRVGRGIRP